MKNITQLGIYMDDSSARFMAIFNGELKTETIHYNVNNQYIGDCLSKNEALMYYKAQQKQHAFYKRIGLELIKYSDVVLFGANQAKYELLNLLEMDFHYDQIKIEVETTEQLNEQEIKGFVKHYFSDNKLSNSKHLHTIEN